MLAMRNEEIELDYSTLKQYAYVEHTFKKESFPTFKDLLHLKRKDFELPIKQKRKHIDLIPPKSSILNESKVTCQPVEFLDDMSFFNRLRGVKGRPTQVIIGSPIVEPSASADPSPEGQALAV